MAHHLSNFEKRKQWASAEEILAAMREDEAIQAENEEDHLRRMEDQYQEEMRLMYWDDEPEEMIAEGRLNAPGYYQDEIDAESRYEAAAA